ncbi:MAG TPA: PaaI family thioesterase [Dissulfurispiraceae bacterium]|nr:PaaI family thioesterase [Dissulfurispiraceae bacterium]
MPEPEDDSFCFVCGSSNPCGLRLTIQRDGAKVFSEFIPSAQFQGYRDIVHGGIVSAVLDEIMVHAAMAESLFAVTAELRVRFKKPARVGRPVRAEGELMRRTSRIVGGAARLIDGETGDLLAEADAKMIIMTPPSLNR